MVKFHSKLYGNGKVPTWKDLKNARYVYRGWVYENRINIYGLTEKNHPFDKDKLITYYEERNESIKQYFKERPNDLIILNLSETNSYKKFCSFVGVYSDKNDFPWENKTSDLKYT